MTQVAAQFTLSVADRVRDWSRQERDLAIALRGLRGAAFPPPAPSSVPPEDIAPFANLSPLVIEDPDHWIEQPTDPIQPNDVGLVPMAPVPMAPVPLAPVPMAPVPMAPPPTGLIPRTEIDVTGAEPSDFPYRPSVAEPAAPPLSALPVSPTMPVTSTEPTGPFDDFIAAVSETGPPSPMAPLPPPSRFMVRVSTVRQPHRATKRNYDYFEELNAKLAAQSAARQQRGQST